MRHAVARTATTSRTGSAQKKRSRRRRCALLPPDLRTHFQAKNEACPRPDPGPLCIPTPDLRLRCPLLPQRSVGKTKVGGIDFNRRRIRWAMEAVLALAPPLVASPPLSWPIKSEAAANKVNPNTAPATPPTISQVNYSRKSGGSCPNRED